MKTQCPRNPRNCNTPAGPSSNEHRMLRNLRHSKGSAHKQRGANIFALGTSDLSSTRHIILTCEKAAVEATREQKTATFIVAWLICIDCFVTEARNCNRTWWRGCSVSRSVPPICKQYFVRASCRGLSSSTSRSGVSEAASSAYVKGLDDS
jgi:hypothetical protein